MQKRLKRNETVTTKKSV